MDNRKEKTNIPDTAVAPGIDHEDSFGRKATKSEIEKGDSTTVTRLIYDEYDPSDI